MNRHHRPEERLMVDEWDVEIVKWPELVGTTAAEAESHIRQNRPEVTDIQAVPPNHDIPMNYRRDRVWLHVDDDGIVIAVPHIG
jgi:hypothetical protein